jgi:hypothetical protein
MAQHYGYGGGDGEQELVKAFNDVSDAAESDAVSAIRTKYFQLGDILEIACARGYTKSLVD